MSGNMVGMVRSAWGRAAAYVRDRRRCAQIKRDIESLGADEGRRVLGEFRLTPKEFEESLRIPFTSEDIWSRALRFAGVDPQRFQREHGARSREMRRICFTCPVKARCRRDLAAGTFERNHQDYCPNRQHFAVLFARKAYQPSMRA